MLLTKTIVSRLQIPTQPRMSSINIPITIFCYNLDLPTLPGVLHDLFPIPLQRPLHIDQKQTILLFLTDGSSWRERERAGDVRACVGWLEEGRIAKLVMGTKDT